MNTPNHLPQRARQHPLLIIAALAVILFCAVGTAAIMGWLPSSHGNNRNALSDADRAALSAGLRQPGTDPNAGVPVAATANAQQGLASLPGQPVPATPLPGQPVPAMTTATAPDYAPQGPANYGAGGSQGATGAGSGNVAYATPEAERQAAGNASVRVAEADNASRWCSNCGNVESIHEITTRARGSGVGAGAGAILGGLLGNQIGSGHGRSLATVAGAVGGAVMGNQVEGNMHANHSYEIRVRLDDGSLHTFHQHSLPQWRTGDRVRVVKGTLHTA